MTERRRRTPVEERAIAHHRAELERHRRIAGELPDGPQRDRAEARADAAAADLRRVEQRP